MGESSGGYVDPSASIAPSAVVWEGAVVRELAALADGVIVGRGVYIGVGVVVGTNSKIQSNALLYEPAVLGNGVFVGPGAILTNDKHPRAVSPNGTLKTGRDWERVGVTVMEGASIGAGAVCVAPVTVGEWALVAAGSVVVQNVPAFALVAGNPAKFVGWVGRAGKRLVVDAEDRRELTCPVTGERFKVIIEGEILQRVSP